MSPSILLGRRTRAMRLVLVVVFVALVVRLVGVQEFGHQHYASLSTSELTQTVTIPAVRGGIYDRNGEVLAESVTKQTVVADPLLITHPSAIAAALSPVLGHPRRPSSGASSPNPPASSTWPTGCPTPWPPRSPPSTWPGSTWSPSPSGCSPTVSWPFPWWGRPDGTGTGRPGSSTSTSRCWPAGRAPRTCWRRPAGWPCPESGTGSVATVPGTGLELTIDESVQYVAEQALGAEIAASHAFSGIAVVEDVKTGDILAMADLQATSGSATTGATAAGQGGAGARRAATSTSGPTLVSRADTLPAGVEEAPSNSAVTQVYEPGSVFKLVTFSAALAAGLITPNQQINVPASLPMGTYTFHDAESHGTENLTASQILAQSSNLGTIEIAQRLGEDPLLAQISNLGFGHPTGLDFPGESQGLVPGASAWTGTSIGSTPIGQDDAVTAQQILDAYNAVANGGVFVAPRLVRGTVSPSGGAVTPVPPVGHPPGDRPDHRRRAGLHARRAW